MTFLPRCVFLLVLTIGCAAAAQQPGPAVPVPNASSAAVSLPPNPQAQPSSWFLRRWGVGSALSPLGFGGRIAVSLTRALNLRVGGNYFSHGLTSSASGVPFTAHVLLQAEEAELDWYPFHGGFRISPGVLFAASNRAYGSARITAGNSFTLNGTTYYSGAADPVNADGFARFPRTAPVISIGWGDWVRRGNARERHWAFPFEIGAAYMDHPRTSLSFSGVVCTDAAQQDCENTAGDSSVQANIAAENRRLHRGAEWMSFYPIISGGPVYRF